MIPSTWHRFMGIDRHEGLPALDAVTIAELRAALLRSAQTGSHGEELKAVLANAAAEARKKGILAEHLLVMLKDVWYSLPQLATHQDSDNQTRLLQQLVARSIQEYYSA